MPFPSASWNVAAMVATNTITTSEYEPTSDVIRQPHIHSGPIQQMKEGKRKYESPQSHELRPKIGERDQPTPPMMKSLFGEEMALAYQAQHNPGFTRNQQQY